MDQNWIIFKCITFVKHSFLPFPVQEKPEKNKTIFDSGFLLDAF